MLRGRPHGRPLLFSYEARPPGRAEEGESMTTICVDVMGADKEPEVLLEGVTRALEKDRPLRASRRLGRRRGALLRLPRARPRPGDHRGHRHGRAPRKRRAPEEGRLHRPCGGRRARRRGGRPLLGRLHRRRAHRPPPLALPHQGRQAPGALPALPGPGQPQDHLFGHGRKRGRQARGHGAVRPHGTRLCRGCLGRLRRALGLCTEAGGHCCAEMALAYHEALANGSCGFAGNAEGTDVLGDRFDVVSATASPATSASRPSRAPASSCSRA